MRLFHSLGHVFGGTLLIAGTTIGVGMLALPVATGESGFVPALVTYLVTWVFMLCTGLLLLEACSWMPKESNFITMTHKLLGKTGRTVCWIAYLFLFVTVMIAHVVGGGSILSEIFDKVIPTGSSMIIYVLLFSPVIYFGTKWVDRLNIVLILGVALSYLLFIFFAYKHVDFTLLSRAEWPKTWAALPILLTAFTYQVIVPTLMNYMDRDVKKVRRSIIYGTTIPLVVYLVWEFLILGIVPAEGQNGLIEASRQGLNAVMPLKEILGHPIVFSIGKSFAFFTLTTSYIALSLAYLDFLADGLKMKKKGWNHILLWLLVFVPPTIIALTNPSIFLIALNYAGGFSIAILFGLFPPLMVWVGRYKRKYTTTRPLIGGGRVFLALLILFAVLEISLEFAQEILHLHF